MVLGDVFQNFLACVPERLVFYPVSKLNLLSSSIRMLPLRWLLAWEGLPLLFDDCIFRLENYLLAPKVFDGLS